MMVVATNLEPPKCYSLLMKHWAVRVAITRWCRGVMTRFAAMVLLIFISLGPAILQVNHQDSRQWNRLQNQLHPQVSHLDNPQTNPLVSPRVQQDSQVGVLHRNHRPCPQRLHQCSPLASQVWIIPHLLLHIDPHRDQSLI